MSRNAPRMWKSKESSFAKKHKFFVWTVLVELEKANYNWQTSQLLVYMNVWIACLVLRECGVLQRQSRCSQMRCLQRGAPTCIHMMKWWDTNGCNVLCKASVTPNSWSVWISAACDSHIFSVDQLPLSPVFSFTLSFAHTHFPISLCAI